ncbi:hypothetical protein ACA910_001495 [Epithemia clementina (nom. ined.)]
MEPTTTTTATTTTTTTTSSPETAAANPSLDVVVVVVVHDDKDKKEDEDEEDNPPTTTCTTTTTTTTTPNTPPKQPISQALAVALVVNYVGVGYILLPYGFSQSGPILGTCVLMLVSTQAYLSSIFILKSCRYCTTILLPRRRRQLQQQQEQQQQQQQSASFQSPQPTTTTTVQEEKEPTVHSVTANYHHNNVIANGANSTTASNSNVNGSGHPPTTSTSTASSEPELVYYEISYLTQLLLGKQAGYFFTFTTACDLFAFCWTFSSVFGQALAHEFPFGRGDDEEDNDSVMDDYQWYIVFFMMVAIPLSCTNLLDQLYLQMAFLATRLIMVACMIGTLIHAHIHSNQTLFQVENDNDDTVIQGRPTDQASIPLTRWSGLLTVIELAVFSTGFQFCVPNMYHLTLAPPPSSTSSSNHNNDEVDDEPLSSADIKNGNNIDRKPQERGKFLAVLMASPQEGGPSRRTSEYIARANASTTRTTTTTASPQQQQQRFQRPPQPQQQQQAVESRHNNANAVLQKPQNFKHRNHTLPLEDDAEEERNPTPTTLQPLQDVLQQGPPRLPAQQTPMVSGRTSGTVTPAGTPRQSQDEQRKDQQRQDQQQEHFFRYAVLFIFASNLCLSLLQSLYFGTDYTDSSSNLNWVGYRGGLFGGNDGSTSTSPVGKYIVLFAALDGLATYPLFALSLGDILRHAFVGPESSSSSSSSSSKTVQPPQGEEVTEDETPPTAAETQETQTWFQRLCAKKRNIPKRRTAFRLLASIPPAVAALFVRDLPTVASLGVIFTLLSYTAGPALLYLAVRRQRDADAVGQDAIVDDRCNENNGNDAVVDNHEIIDDSSLHLYAWSRNEQKQPRLPNSAAKNEDQTTLHNNNNSANRKISNLKRARRLIGLKGVAWVWVLTVAVLIVAIVINFVMNNNNDDDS